MKIVAIVPAYNEANCIEATITALLAQQRKLDQIVIIPNGCTDNTADLARNHASGENHLLVLELPRLEHKKSEALNIGWDRFARDADLVLCLDADTILPPNAVLDWEREFQEDQEAHRCGSPQWRQRRHRHRLHQRRKFRPLGGSSSKFTMLGSGFLTKLQKAEFAKWTATSLARGYTTVLAGTGCMIDGAVLRRVASETGRLGPWSYDSQVEDFELTKQIIKLGYRCQVSPDVRAYTDSMKTIKSLWNQRMKWQVGTIEDLITFGLNRYTLVDWFQQASGLFSAFFRAMWLVLIFMQVAIGAFAFNALWWIIVPIIFTSMEAYSIRLIPHRDRKDTLMSITLLPTELFAWIRTGWFVASWASVLTSMVTGKRKDRWAAQYTAEGIDLSNWEYNRAGHL